MKFRFRLNFLIPCITFLIISQPVFATDLETGQTCTQVGETRMNANGTGLFACLNPGPSWVQTAGNRSPKVLTVVGPAVTTLGVFSRASCAKGTTTDGTSLSGLNYAIVGGGCWATGGAFGGEGVPVGVGASAAEPVNPSQISDYASNNVIDNAYYCYYSNTTSGQLRAIALCEIAQ